VKFVKGELPANRVAPALPVLEPAPQPPPAGATPDPSNAGKATAVPLTHAKSGSVPFNKDDFENDPLIQKALEMFKGQIVEVRA